MIFLGFFDFRIGFSVFVIFLRCDSEEILAWPIIPASGREAIDFHASIVCRIELAFLLILKSLEAEADGPSTYIEPTITPRSTRT